MSLQQRIFELCKILKGNIVEIGAGKGDSTVMFLQAVKDTDRKVCVIDPFESGWNDMPSSYSRPYPKSLFIQNIEEYQNNNLILIEKSSQDQSVFEDIKHLTPVSFFFIDGLQYEDAVLSDLDLAVKCDSEIICLDDYTRSTDISQVPSAVKKFISKNYSYYLEHKDGDRECYLIKKDLIV